VNQASISASTGAPKTLIRIYCLAASFERKSRLKKITDCMNRPGMLKLFAGRGSFATGDLLIADRYLSRNFSAHSAGDTFLVRVGIPRSSTTFASII
jgi:hypothetical protein